MKNISVEGKPEQETTKQSSVLGQAWRGAETAWAWAEWLRSLTALPGAWGSVPSMHMADYNQP